MQNAIAALATAGQQADREKLEGVFWQNG